MSRLEIVYFGVILFFALSALNEWKRRRYKTTERINRGLHSYISGDATDAYTECDPASV